MFILSPLPRREINIRLTYESPSPQCLAYTKCSRNVLFWIWNSLHHRGNKTENKQKFRKGWAYFINNRNMKTKGIDSNVGKLASKGLKSSSLCPHNNRRTGAKSSLVWAERWFLLQGNCWVRVLDWHIQGWITFWFIFYSSVMWRLYFHSQ